MWPIALFASTGGTIICACAIAMQFAIFCITQSRAILWSQVSLAACQQKYPRNDSRLLLAAAENTIPKALFLGPRTGAEETLVTAMQLWLHGPAYDPPEKPKRLKSSSLLCEG